MTLKPSGINLAIDGKEADIAAKVHYNIVSTSTRTQMTICGQWNVPGDYNVTADNIGHSIDQLSPNLQQKVRDGVDQVIDLTTKPTIVQSNIQPPPTVVIVPPTHIVIQPPLIDFLPPAPIFFQPPPVSIVPPAVAISSPSPHQ
ncbi:unnamed protein product [Orchesella dallaii]|uniref:Uncharacterized protein n=1 Tax=Orchesella dallaii TaxID=48710 RepID=A0ABP1RL33_9HEXA